MLGKPIPVRVQRKVNLDLDSDMTTTGSTTAQGIAV